MGRSIVLALLTLVAIAVSVPTSYAQPREEIKLTTIIPDQQVLRVKKGIISTTNYRQATFPDTNIPDKSLIVEGNVGIGTTNPQAPAPNSQIGNLDVNDVYLRSAGKWASESGAGQGSLLTNGYQKLPGGLILQWGVCTQTFGEPTQVTTTFPIPFSNACLNVNATARNPTANSAKDNFPNIVSMSKTTFICLAQSPGHGDMDGFYWFAIGY